MKSKEAIDLVDKTHLSLDGVTHDCLQNIPNNQLGNIV